MQKINKSNVSGRQKRWEKELRRFKKVENEIRENARDILNSPNFLKTKCHIQHGNMTVNDHVMSVARTSLLISDRLHIKCNRKELIRGALLHDYFLYDWHIPDPVNSHKLHGFYHPGTALKNAMNEFTLTEKEKNIIQRHMWPLTPIPPKCKEAWIVTAADKWCSLRETLHLRKGHGAIIEKLRKK